MNPNAPLGVFFACLALVAWGAGDFLIQRSARRFGDWAALFYIELFATTILLPFVWSDLAGLASGDWIFLIDADERITHELAQEIKELIAKNPKDNGFWVNRRNWFLGEFLKKGGAYPDRVIRLFRRGKGKLPEINVHEQLKINGEVGYLRKDLLHIADPMFSRYLERANRYTTQTAQEFKKEDVGRGLSKALYFMVLKPFFVFIKIYFRHKGYQDGFRGFIWALFSAIHYFYAYVKYWEIKKININSEKLLTKAQN